MSLIIGIDPGFKGAIGSYNPLTHGVASCYDMPLMPKTHLWQKAKERSYIDVGALAALLRPMDISLAIVEQVSASPGAGVVGMFRFGEGYGMVLGVLAALQIRTVKVIPSVWKPQLGLSRDKKDSITAALEIPGAAPYLTLRKHDGRAEAILLAKYGADRLTVNSSFKDAGRGIDDL